ncbi:MAG: glycosyltransferase family 2 protein, partial [Lachnospiraceae bacterium]|nr:glycosyltransferase family 2 protein [Lachnospiraceae bacterium]
SMGGYIKKSMLTIIRAFMMYKPLVFFLICGSIPFGIGAVMIIRFLIFFAKGNGMGHIQSLVVASMLVMMGFMTFILGLQADIIAANRKLLEDVQFRIRRMEIGGEDK